MQRKLTITIADDVYQGLHQQIGRGEISRFIENAVRPYLVTTDTVAEREATDWIEANIDEALD
jgi:hypothetical protein